MNETCQISREPEPFQRCGKNEASRMQDEVATKRHVVALRNCGLSIAELLILVAAFQHSKSFHAGTPWCEKPRPQPQIDRRRTLVADPRPRDDHKRVVGRIVAPFK